METNTLWNLEVGVLLKFGILPPSVSWLHVNQRFQADILICVIPKKRMYTPIRVVKMQNPDATCWPGRGATEPPFSAGGNAPRCSRFDGFL